MSDKIKNHITSGFIFSLSFASSIININIAAMRLVNPNIIRVSNT